MLEDCVGKAVYLELSGRVIRFGSFLENPSKITNLARVVDMQGRLKIERRRLRAKRK